MNTHKTTSKPFVVGFFFCCKLLPLSVRVRRWGSGQVRDTDSGDRTTATKGRPTKEKLHNGSQGWNPERAQERRGQRARTHTHAKACGTMDGLQGCTNARISHVSCTWHCKMQSTQHKLHRDSRFSCLLLHACVFACVQDIVVKLITHTVKENLRMVRWAALMSHACVWVCVFFFFCTITTFLTFYSVSFFLSLCFPALDNVFLTHVITALCFTPPPPFAAFRCLCTALLFPSSVQSFMLVYFTDLLLTDITAKQTTTKYLKKIINGKYRCEQTS